MALVLATEAPSGEAEIFASLQGEGPSAGRPVAFIRLSRCNLACQWCDTAYTWHFTGDDRAHRDGATYERKANQISLTEQEAANRIIALGQSRLVITGGEPLLQAPALTRLVALLPDMAIELETNGTIIPPADLDDRIAQYNVSPKLAHSGNDAALALPEKALAYWAANQRAFFKFVISQPEDVAQVLALQDRYGLARDRVFLMAEGTQSAALHEREKWLAPLCLEHGFRMSDRLHIHLYGDSRGT